MPNDEHLAVLRRGTAAWNAWCAENRETADLAQAGLRGLDLSGYDLSRADLRGALLWRSSGRVGALAHIIADGVTSLQQCSNRDAGYDPL